MRLGLTPPQNYPSIRRGHTNFHFERSRYRYTVVYTVVDRLDGDGIGLRPATGGFDLRIALRYPYAARNYACARILQTLKHVGRFTERSGRKVGSL
jgi:hypothetical protein